MYHVKVFHPFFKIHAFSLAQAHIQASASQAQAGSRIALSKKGCMVKVLSKSDSKQHE
jgi:hypothetical protein